MNNNRTDNAIIFGICFSATITAMAVIGVAAIIMEALENRDETEEKEKSYGLKEDETWTA